ncbi:aldo/keto reductase [Nostoc sp. 'Peltigera membranacea cyanobiont' N6]|uniref:aldo/keto reductase n=1 Tax=Nostoc sp. 'Peltigera membranacea cyanobiont' N6 TaxID=1261031 RepID=UPI000CF323DA|nr:aldo/keto reductase [Nostoc sp. 'Peltigera membranacea cyanobiont' N6]AVH67215.1 aldo/keto reductase [Nostoc sp. 'Peltigera membranacea cyanobiont' N6]
MQTKQLGNSELHITPIGFGAWAIGGGGWAFGWGAQDDRESIEAINRALDLGVNWIDTAAIYGLGHSEEVVAKALKGRSSRPYIFTKCSMIWDEKGEIGRSLKADSVRREVEASLRRLDIETIDLYQIHWPNPDSDIEEGWTTLAKLKDEGKVRYIGVSNFNVEQLKRIQNIAPVTSLQPPYSLVKPDVEKEILPFCKENNIGVIVYSPMQSGLLTGKMTSERIANLPDDDWRKESSEFQKPRLSRNLKLVEVLQQIGKQYDRAAGEVAIAWTLNNPAVTAAIVGARNPQQVDGIIAAGEFRLNQQELEQIGAFLRENP